MSARTLIGILAGGAGRRMGGADKGWIERDGVPAIVRLIEGLRPQHADIVISANRNLARYQALGIPVVTDAQILSAVVAHDDSMIPAAKRATASDPDRPVYTTPEKDGGYAGPLAGVCALLAWAGGRRRLLTLPVDIIGVPPNLAAEFAVAAEQAPNALSVAVDADGRQPLIASYPPSVAGSVLQAFAVGERSVRRWQNAFGWHALRFPNFRFGNLNTLPESSCR